jgi:GxxExxY protein
VHRQFGPGLLESVYTACLAHELLAMGLGVEIEKPMPLDYKGVHIPRAYVLDLVVENRLIVEIKRVDRIADIHVAQILTYLRLTGISVGLILNFNVASLKDGIKRVVHTAVAEADGRKN